MNTSRAQDALRILSDVAAEREHKLIQFSASRADESDDEADAESPIFDSFYNVGGNESILKITNFTAPEFRKLYSILQQCITSRWNSGREKNLDLSLWMFSLCSWLC